MHLFIDIDGVILGKRSPRDVDVVLAANAREFLEFALGNFDPRWLSTRSTDGSVEPVVRCLSPYCDAATLDLVRRIPPARFVTLKTEAFAEIGDDFLWIDDSPLGIERTWLVEHDLLDRWVPCDTRRRPGDLDRVMEVLRERLTVVREHRA